MRDLVHPDARLVDGATGTVLGGAVLAARVDAAAAACRRRPRGPVLALLPREPGAVVTYLGALRAGMPVAPLDPALPAEVLADLVRRYQPALVTGLAAARRPADPPAGYRRDEAGVLGPVWRRRTPPAVEPHPELALLLTTSGSTGSPKLVRLSGHAVLANADAIAAALGIDGGEVAPTSLPLFYSYGLSVLHSHLRRGATVVLERSDLVTRDFWTALSRFGYTSLAGVPHQYETLRRLRFDPARHPTLRTLTQAGGRLDPEAVRDFHGRMAACGGRLFIMYGQTEAAPRITTLPWDRLPEKAATVGPAVPGGRLSVRTADGAETTAAGVVGEVVYRGPNVMMGYAERAADLARGDELGGVLPTGDVGRLDAEGFLVITGRARRIGKVFGVRVNLDDAERLLSGHGALAAVAGADRIVVFAEATDPGQRARIRSALSSGLGTHSSGVDVRPIDRLPRLSTGKVDYRALERRA